MGFLEARQAAQRAFSLGYNQGLVLYGHLIRAERREVYSEALAAAVGVVRSLIRENINAAFSLLVDLILKGIGLDEAIVVAKIALRSDDVEIISKVIKFYTILVNVGIESVYREAITAATQAFIDGSTIQLKKDGFELFNQLFSKRQGFDAAIRAAAEAVRSRQSIMRLGGLRMYIKLISLRLAEIYSVAAAAGVESIHSGNSDLINSGVELVDKLISDGQADLIQRTLQDLPAETQALPVFEKIFSRIGAQPDKKVRVDSD